MITVSLTQAKREFEHLVDQVIGGEEVSITRWGKPVARLVRASREPTMQADRCLRA
jgi:prevent-host-death family protein